MEKVASVKPRDLPNPSGQIDRLIADHGLARQNDRSRSQNNLRSRSGYSRGIQVDGDPVWSRDGIIAVANAFKGRVNVTFAYGASLPDPEKLFNAGFEGNARRAINFFEDDKINSD
jgi:hypothetical protein